MQDVYSDYENRVKSQLVRSWLELFQKHCRWKLPHLAVDSGWFTEDLYEDPYN